MMVKAAIARYARTLSTMFSAGVPLVEALESVAGATGNIVYELGVLRVRDEVSTGQRLQQAMENTDLFPNMVIQMIAVGEESGSLDDMSAKVADFYEEDVDNAVDNLSSLLEPMIMSTWTASKRPMTPASLSGTTWDLLPTSTKKYLAKTKSSSIRIATIQTMSKGFKVRSFPMQKRHNKRL